MAYTEPTVTDVRMRYPVMGGVDDATINYWLTDSARFVDASWLELDYIPAKVAAACHAMIKAQVAGIADGEFDSLLSAGVTDFQSGGREGFRASFSADAIKEALSGEFDTTRPGQEYMRMLARNKSGPRTSAPGALPYGFGYPQYNGPLGLTWPS